LMHISTYLDVIIMFCIDLWGFFYQTLVLCILTFREPSRTQIDRDFVWC
jgi:hypothetical protein